MKFWDNKGNIAVMAALTMPLIVGGAGLGVETGYWYYEQLRLQQAADAAAYAAALEHVAGDEEDMEGKAADAAASNGYQAGVDELLMTWPSQVEPGNDRTVDVTLTRTVPRAFSALFGSDEITIRAKATAKYDPSSNACLLALAPSAANSVWITGSGKVDIAGCVVSSNSVNNVSINAGGSSTSSMPCMTSAGGVSLSNVTFTDPACPGPITHQPPAADPYDDVPIPPSTCPSGKSWPGGNPRVHTPGTYCGKIPNITNSVHIFSPGTYIFDGADLAVVGQGGMKCVAPGCTFIFKNGASIDVHGTAHLDLVAPTTGDYAGMLFMGDHSNTATQKFNGASGSAAAGVIYFPAGTVEYLGNVSGFHGCTQVVAKMIKWSGNATLSVDCSAYGMGVIQIGGRPYLIG